MTCSSSFPALSELLRWLFLLLQLSTFSSFSCCFVFAPRRGDAADLFFYNVHAVWKLVRYSGFFPFYFGVIPCDKWGQIVIFREKVWVWRCTSWPLRKKCLRDQRIWEKRASDTEPQVLGAPRAWGTESRVQESPYGLNCSCIKVTEETGSSRRVFSQKVALGDWLFKAS